jgi:2-iminobutanoate/2-iminopropanoate deaminase
MLKPINPPTVAPPFSRYSQAIEAPGGLRWLHISGQVGVRPDGTVEQGFPAQAERAWNNLLAILAAAGMGPADLVKVNVYLTRAGDVVDSRRIRDTKLAGAAPASTLAVVAALASPQWLFEIEAVAAKA